MYVFSLQVACKQLGYLTGLIKDGRAGSGIIWLDDIVCRSTNVARLIDCSHSDWGQENCGHHEDISIICYNDTDTRKSVYILTACTSIRETEFSKPRLMCSEIDKTKLPCIY